MTQLERNQAQGDQPPQKQRLLQQVHPAPRDDAAAALPPESQASEPPVATALAEEEVLHFSAQEQDFWEGRYRLGDGTAVSFQARRIGQQVHIWIGGEFFVFSPVVSASRSRRGHQISTDEILCSVPGVVIAVHVSEGDAVSAGQDLLVIESMKTEQVVKSPRDGTVQRVPVQPGDRVDRGMRLVVLVPLESD